MEFTLNKNFEYFLYFVAERMEIFWNKYNKSTHPYTEDKILQEHKFTNVYRVLDRSSQYLLSNVIYNGKTYSKEDMFFRIILYKNYNLPFTWDTLVDVLGDVTLDTSAEDLYEVLSVLNKFQPVYSNAYMLTCPFMRKESFLKEYHLEKGNPKYLLYFKIFKKDLIEKGVMEECFKAKSFEDLFNSLKKILSFGDFLAYQMAQDLNYSPLFNFDQNEFCAAGPGTKRGIDRCFNITGKVDYGEIVKWTQKNFNQLLERFGFEFNSLPGWEPKVPDISNCFCETDKYLRGLGVMTVGKNIKGKRIKSKFIENPKEIKLTFPPKWNIKL